ncbi:hypothetical protein YC2023_117590 [Brassica napus]
MSVASPTHTLTSHQNRDEANLKTIMWTVESMSSQRIKKVLFASELKDFFGAINRPNAWPALRLLGAFVVLENGKSKV